MSRCRNLKLLVPLFFRIPLILERKEVCLIPVSQKAFRIEGKDGVYWFRRCKGWPWRSFVALMLGFLIFLSASYAAYRAEDFLAFLGLLVPLSHALSLLGVRGSEYLYAVSVAVLFLLVVFSGSAAVGAFYVAVGGVIAVSGIFSLIGRCLILVKEAGDTVEEWPVWELR